jgi:hypothetical protein
MHPARALPTRLSLNIRGELSSIECRFQSILYAPISKLTRLLGLRSVPQTKTKMCMEFWPPRLLAMHQYERDVYDHVHAEAEIETTERV